MCACICLFYIYTSTCIYIRIHPFRYLVMGEEAAHVLLIHARTQMCVHFIYTYICVCIALYIIYLCVSNNTDNNTAGT